MSDIQTNVMVKTVFGDTSNMEGFHSFATPEEVQQIISAKLAANRPTEDQPVQQQQAQAVPTKNFYSESMAGVESFAPKAP